MEHIKEVFNTILSSRIRVVIICMILFGSMLISRLFYLQIINGASYQDNYNLKLEKLETIPATRGNIYDRNGELLAYNELVYAVTIQDNGTYSSTNERNKSLNSEIGHVIKKLKKNGDIIDNNFGIILNSSNEYEFIYSGTNLQRFRADIFGHSSVDDLEYNSKIKINEAEATAQQIMDYLQSDKVYNISSKYSKTLRYEITVIRYNMGQNSYQKYISTIIASDVSDETVAFVKENINEFTGIDIEEKSIRKYVDSEYFSHIIGYTGQISPEEYEKLSIKNKKLESTDIIGKSGIEKCMTDYLEGTKGHETLYVDSVGNTIAKGDCIEAISGRDVYLSIDKNLQKAAYILLEQEIAGILYTKIANVKEYNASEHASASDVVVPIYDVYNSFIKNNLIDINEFNNKNATANEKAILAAYSTREKMVLNQLKEYLSIRNKVPYSDLPAEYQKYSTYIVTMLKNSNVFNADAIDGSSEMQTDWMNEKIPVNDYLYYAIENSWIDITTYETEAKYADTDELYNDLVNYILETLQNDSGFKKLVYKYLILNDEISGNQLCAVLYEQGILEMDEEQYHGLLNNSIPAFDFVKNKIKTLELTPGQLALDPCSGSTVVLDTKTGEILACVSYPGYDNNKLANNVDTSYYAYLTFNESNPLYNYATQQRTAPGSTFKIVSSTAGLSEGVITTTSEIVDNGVFEKVSNKPKCWVYPSAHGSINVSEAIRDSCNCFFYEVGWRLSGGDNNYNDERGIKKIQKYASLYGLDKKTGIEIEENDPQIANEYPVMAAIGQSNNNFTTVGLARYATAIASKGNVYDLSLLDSVRDADGNVIKKFGPSLRNKVDVLNQEQWDAIHTGMNMVCENLTCFNSFSINVAGKTGTAQLIKSRPNHALFIGFAPYENPEVAIATRIAYGYTSHNAAAVSKDILSYWFGVAATEDLLNGQATEVTNTENEVTD